MNFVLVSVSQWFLAVQELPAKGHKPVCTHVEVKRVGGQSDGERWWQKHQQWSEISAGGGRWKTSCSSGTSDLNQISLNTPLVFLMAPLKSSRKSPRVTICIILSQLETYKHERRSQTKKLQLPFLASFTGTFGAKMTYLLPKVNF